MVMFLHEGQEYNYLNMELHLLNKWTLSFWVMTSCYRNLLYSLLLRKLEVEHDTKHFSSNIQFRLTASFNREKRVYLSPTVGSTSLKFKQGASA